MRVSDIVANKDKVLPENLYDKEASGVVLVLNPKWTKRQVYDEAVKVLDKHGDMPAITVPPMVWELMDLANAARESLLSQLDTKTKLADAYANQVIELESKLADAEVKKKGEMADLGLVGDPKAPGDSERLSESGNVTHDANIVPRGGKSAGVTGTDRSPDK